MTSARSDHEHDWHPSDSIRDVAVCECGVMLAHGQVFYPAWEWLSTPEGTVHYEHPVGEAVRKHIEENPVTAQSEAPESPFDHAWFVAHGLVLSTLKPGVEYTLVRNNDSSDAGRSECYFADANDAERYVARLKAAFDAGTLGEPHFHPQPARLDLMVYMVTRRA